MAILGLLGSQAAEKEMSFGGHFNVLKGHLFRSAFVVFGLSIIFFCYPEFLFDTIIFGPIRADFITYEAFCKLGHLLNLGNDLCFGSYSFKLQSLGLSDQFSSQMWIALIGGMILGSPYVLWEIWRFIEPALSESEKKASGKFIFFATILFVLGILFSYYIIVPLMVNFLGNYKVSSIIENNFTMDSYISTVTTLSLATGLMFELPILIYFLTRFNLITPEFMRQYRKHAVIVILIISAIITPSPDVMSQLLVAIPLFLLYELSIFVSRNTIKRMSVN